ncbi:uncharacterized protein LOC130719873 [Lotus japonicus]|uniref:uncharacterized protein LOC130719873 n=1 Tax=Lotus japonicus TaxID=34305 RepID=UPI00258D1066|nr:uncharacterized protein LOC130719873 [Lotus japonicus]
MDKGKSHTSNPAPPKNPYQHPHLNPNQSHPPDPNLRSTSTSHPPSPTLASSSAKEMHNAEPPIEGGLIELQCEEEMSEELARRTLVGKVIYDKVINKTAMKTILSKAWGDPIGLQMTEMGPNCLIFTFQEQSTARKVLKEGPWSIMGNLLSLQLWAPQMTIYEVRFHRISFWVQLHGLPLDMMTTSNATRIASILGEPLEVEDPRVAGKLLRPFFRVRVSINTNNPFVTGFWVPRKRLPKVWITLKYEKLQGYCYNCGVAGHEQKGCKAARALSSYNPSMPRFSKSLGVPQARSLASLAAAKNYGGIPRRSDNRPSSDKEEFNPEPSEPEQIDQELRYWQRKLSPDLEANGEQQEGEDSISGDDTEEQETTSSLNPTTSGEEAAIINPPSIPPEAPPTPNQHPNTTSTAPTPDPQFVRQMISPGPPMVKVFYNKALVEYGAKEKQFNYYVEFPDEEQTNDTSPLQNLDTECIQNLSEDFTETLSLKRGREDSDSTDLAEGRRIKRLMITNTTEEFSHQFSTAEEAGQSMPPTPK